VVMQVEQIPDSFVQLAALRVPRQQELLGAGAAAKGRCVTYHAGGSASPAIAWFLLPGSGCSRKNSTA
jgi:hypothetical protein